MTITQEDLFKVMDANKDWKDGHQSCKRIVFANGASVSIQASAYHYCCPRESSINGTYSDYWEFELGFPSIKPNDSIMQYAEQEETPIRTIYSYVPVQLIVDWINENGGLQTT